jgi:hypothetical protein
MVDYPTDSVMAKNAAAKQEEPLGDSVPSVAEDDTMEQSSQEEEEDKDEAMRRRWKESPFAVGRTQTTWADEEATCATFCNAYCASSRYSYVLCSAILCRKAGRVGNMVVLAQRMEEVVDVSGVRIRRPRIMCIVGPYW